MIALGLMGSEGLEVGIQDVVSCKGYCKGSSTRVPSGFSKASIKVCEQALTLDPNSYNLYKP